MNTIKSVFISVFVFWALPVLTQSNFVVLSGSAGIQFTQTEIDTLESIADEIVEIFDTYTPNISDSFKIFEFQYYLHNKVTFERHEAIAELAISSIQSQSPYYFLIIKVMSPTSIIEEVLVKFNFPTGPFPCLDATAIGSNLEAVANNLVKSSTTNLSYSIDYAILRLLQQTVAEGFCCSEYINNQNQNHNPTPTRTQGCSLINQDTVSDLVTFLQSDAAYNTGLSYLYLVLNWYEGCNTTDWKPFEPGGIVPYCFWAGTGPPEVPYTSSDLPFNFGCIDGIAIGTRNVVEGLLALPDAMKTVEDIIEAYTIYYIRCTGREPTQGEIAAAWNELKLITWSNGTYEDNFDNLVAYVELKGLKFWADAKSLIYGQDKNIKWCQDKDRIRSTIELVAKTISNFDSLTVIYSLVIASIDDIWEDIDGISNEERYYQGCYAMSIAIEFLNIAKAEKIVSQIYNVVDEAAINVTDLYNYGLRNRFTVKAADRLLEKIKNNVEYKQLGSLRQQFDLDFGGQYGSLLKIYKDNLIGVYKKLSDRDAWVRSNTNLLKKLAYKDDAYINKVNDLYNAQKFNKPSDLIPPNVSNGINFDEFGFPDFKPFAPQPAQSYSYISENLVGSQSSTDFTSATNWLKTQFPNQNIVKQGNRVIIDDVVHTWHHHQDGKTMIPVPSNIHSISHTGGNAVLSRGLKGLFDNAY